MRGVLYSCRHPKQRTMISANKALRLFSNADDKILEAGIDEVGRGALAGPVVAAAVVWPRHIDGDDTTWTRIRDSKKLTRLQRERLADYIRDTALDFAVGIVGPDVIDRDNILNANFRAMHEAVDGLSMSVDRLLVDGPIFKPYLSTAGEFVPHECVVQGDDSYVSIAAASILAKVCRDRMMVQLHEEHPEFGWDSNKGYGSSAHTAALRRHGPTHLHRRTFLGKILQQSPRQPSP